MQDRFIPSGKRPERSTLFNSSSCIEAYFLRQPGGPCTLPRWASQRSVHREWTVRVIIVIVIVSNFRLAVPVTPPPSVCSSASSSRLIRIVSRRGLRGLWLFHAFTS